MGGDYGYLAILAPLLLSCVLLYTQIRARPEQFSSQSIHASLWILGLLALCLIALIGIVALSLGIVGGS